MFPLVRKYWSLVYCSRLIPAGGAPSVCFELVGLRPAMLTYTWRETRRWDRNPHACVRPRKLHQERIH